MHVLPLLMIPRQHAMRPNTTVTDHTPHCTWEPFCLLSYSGTHSPDVALTRLLDRLWCSARPWMVASGACLPRCFEVRIHPAFFSGLPSPTPPTHPYPCSHFHLLYLCLPGPAAAIGAYYATNRRRGCPCSVSDWEIAEKTESGVASLQDQPSESLMAVLHKVMPSKQDSGMHAISLYSHAQLCMHVRRARAALTAPSHRAVELLSQPCAAEEAASASERSDPLDL